MKHDDPRGVGRRTRSEVARYSRAARRRRCGTRIWTCRSSAAASPLQGRDEGLLGGDGPRQLAGDNSALPNGTCWTLIISTTTDQETRHADEESTPPMAALCCVSALSLWVLTITDARRCARSHAHYAVGTGEREARDFPRNGRHGCRRSSVAAPKAGSRNRRTTILSHTSPPPVGMEAQTVWKFA